MKEQLNSTQQLSTVPYPREIINMININIITNSTTNSISITKINNVTNISNMDKDTNTDIDIDIDWHYYQYQNKTMYIMSYVVLSDFISANLTVTFNTLKMIFIHIDFNIAININNDIYININIQQPDKN